MRDFVKSAIFGAASTDKKSGNIEVNGDLAAQIFRRSWFFSDNKPFSGDLKSAYGSFVGLFRKNIDITDISHPEIVVLFRKHIRMSDASECSPLFHTTNDTFEILRKSMLPGSQVFFSNSDGSAEENFEKYVEQRSNDFVEYYGSIFEKTIIADFKKTSFTCHIPNSLRVNFKALVSQSGYIHSLGNQVYVRRAKKATIAELKQGLENLLVEFDRKQPAYFTAYSPEFFNSEETKSSESMANGLDGVKLSARKHHIGPLSIIDAVPTIVAECNRSLGREALYSPSTDDYSTERTSNHFAEKFTIFLIQDRSLVYSKTDRQLKSGSEIYLICYAQRLKNENPTHIFKESKPGWLEPVTMPHTLSSAHINIATGRLREGQIIAMDPFCGSGTTLIDVAQRFPDAKLVGFDRNPNSIRITKENFLFLSSRKSEILRIFENLDAALSDLKREGAFNVNQVVQYFREIQRNPSTLENLSFPHRTYEDEEQTSSNKAEDRKQTKLGLLQATAFVLGAIARNSGKEYVVDDVDAVNLSTVNFSSINKFIDGDGPFTRNFNGDNDYPNILEKITDINSRFVIYAIWRAIFYSSFRFQNDLSQMYDVLSKEIRSQVIRYRDFFKYSDYPNDKIGINSSFDGLFSEYVKPADENINFDENSIQNAELFSLDELNASIRGGQRLNLMKVENSIDTMDEIAKFPDGERPNLIVTDPPYGFNTDENGPSDIEKMFSKLAGTLFDVVAPNGVIAVTLPGQSRNGKEIPFYETRTMFVRKLLDYAGTSSRSIISRASILPDSNSFPRPAFRWNAERGVSRHSLIFQVK